MWNLQLRPSAVVVTKDQQNRDTSHILPENGLNSVKHSHQP